MDQLSKRYADPCFFLDGMIATGRLDEFVTSFVKTTNEEKEDELDWEFFLHKVWEGTFQDFKSTVRTNKENKAMSKSDIETTVLDSLSILKNFSPNE